MENDIVWTPVMSVNDKNIDSQHKEIIETLRKFGEKIVLRANINQVKGLIDVFEDYSVKHLDHEEKYMKAHKFPELDNHKKLHDSYKEYFKDLNKKLKDEQSDQFLAKLVDIERFLSNWWTNHILVEDRKYALYIKSHPK